ncbi:TIGR04282 family arsenosugar biosynthesis glycosyltransferase [Arenicella xantha]|uniref:Glycosyltransferase A (GT-A) superfamily protein (DUF2064 family) n=1 Tax=Arenicella xantha TaxID=644221 RepID=A0A395JPF2_9GAMM|nr:TIGR04282 family arsenosugar biosynthesis glycosyltransferase [Arenicella xantha]RBP53377.1 hypothetical protein DFR28_101763 [Arenicella xantha]
MNADIPLILFAKAPIPGKVKTRLQSHCSAQQAAYIASYLMEASIQAATRHWPGSVYLSVWLDEHHSFFETMQTRYPVRMTVQTDGDLGEKMRHALHSFGYPAVVMGCDAPHTAAATYVTAFERLQQGESVIAPSDDGGYYLLGLAQPANALFLDKPWGTADVLSQTMQSAATLGLSLHELDSLNDIDEWNDLIAVLDQFDDLREYLSSEGLIL